jgi:hypothetical protein
MGEVCKNEFNKLRGILSGFSVYVLLIYPWVTALCTHTPLFYSFTVVL